MSDFLFKVSKISNAPTKTESSSTHRGADGPTPGAHHIKEQLEKEAVSSVR